MRIELTELLWLDEHEVLSLDELAGCSGLTQTELQALVEEGALTPVDQSETPLAFRAECVVFARIAGRLKHDFQLDISALTVALTLIDRIHDLEQQLHRMNAQMPRRLH